MKSPMLTLLVVYGLLIQNGPILSALANNVHTFGRIADVSPTNGGRRVVRSEGHEDQDMPQLSGLCGSVLRANKATRKECMGQVSNQFRNGTNQAELVAALCKLLEDIGECYARSKDYCSTNDWSKLENYLDERFYQIFNDSLDGHKCARSSGKLVYQEDAEVELITPRNVDELLVMNTDMISEMKEFALSLVKNYRGVRKVTQIRKDLEDKYGQHWVIFFYPYSDNDHVEWAFRFTPGTFMFMQYQGNGVLIFRQVYVC